MTKAERIDYVQNSLHSEEELIRRLPEIDAIYDEDLRKGVVRAYLYGCPDYFWERPSSSTGKYHSPDERGDHGNWIHTKRVFAKYCKISEGWLEMGRITEYQREAGKAAALLHDMMKYGWPSDGNEHTVNDHDLIAADVAEHIGQLPDEVVEQIKRHMGAWGEGPNPETDAQLLLHTSDMAVVKAEDDIALYYPADELVDEWPDLTAIEPDEPI